MAKAGGLRLRSVWRNIHLWIGAGLFVILAPLGVTGSLLVWDDSLDKLAHPDRYHAASGVLAPSAYLNAAAQGFAGKAVIAQLRMPTEPGGSVVVSGFQPGPVLSGRRPPQLSAWIDPASARVIAVANPRQELRGVIHNIHGNMLLPVSGRPFVGWLGVLMVISCTTGLCIWWPRNSGLLVKALRWTRSPSVFSNVHHMVGFWICLPLALLSLTGSYIAFPQAMKAMFGPRPVAAAAAGPGGQGQQRGRFPPPIALPAMTADKVLAAALGADDDLKGARLVQITLPTEGGKPAWRVQLKPADGPPVAVRVDDASGMARVQDTQANEGPAGADPIGRWMRRTHDGSQYGRVWQVIIFVTGLAPLLLGLTGIIVWLSRRKVASA